MEPNKIKSYYAYLKEANVQDYLRDDGLFEIKGTPEYAFAMEGMRLRNLIEKVNPYGRDGDYSIERRKRIDGIIENDVIPTLDNLYNQFGKNPIFSLLFLHKLKEKGAEIKDGNEYYDGVSKGFPFEILDDAIEANEKMRKLVIQANEGLRIIEYLLRKVERLREIRSSRSN